MRYSLLIFEFFILKALQIMQELFPCSPKTNISVEFEEMSSIDETNLFSRAVSRRVPVPRTLSLGNPVVS